MKNTVQTNHQTFLNLLSFFSVGAFNFFSSEADANGGTHWALWLFNWAFAATSATIVSGAIAERLQFKCAWGWGRKGKERSGPGCMGSAWEYRCLPACLAHCLANMTRQVVFCCITQCDLLLALLCSCLQQLLTA